MRVALRFPGTGRSAARISPAAQPRQTSGARRRPVWAGRSVIRGTVRRHQCRRFLRRTKSLPPAGGTFVVRQSGLRHGRFRFAPHAFPIPGSVARGVCQTDADGCLQSVVELTRIEPDGAGAKNTNAAGRVTPLTGDETVSMNCWGFTPAVFPALCAKFTTFLEKNGRDEKAEFYIPSVCQRFGNVRPGAGESVAHR